MSCRYDAITHPMNFTGSWRRAKVLVIAAWLLSAAFASPILHFYNTTETEDYGTQCWINFEQPWQWQLYMTLVSVTLFVIPACMIAACYIIIVCTIWNKGREQMNLVRNRHFLLQQAKSTASNYEEAEATAALGSGTDSPRRASSRGLIPKAKVKTIKMTFVIISVFILCWSPYIVFDLLQVNSYMKFLTKSRGLDTMFSNCKCAKFGTKTPSIENSRLYEVEHA